MKKLNLLFFGLILVISQFAFSQNSILFDFKNGTSNSYLLSNVQKITYTETSLKLHLKNGSVTAWNLSDINKYGYSDVTPPIQNGVVSVNDNSGTSVCYGQSKTLIVTGYEGTSLQWQSSTSPTAETDQTGWQDVLGATDPVFVFTEIVNNTSYRVVVTNDGQESYSNVLTISLSSYPGIISGTSSICAGSSTTLTIENSLGTIQWQKSTTPTNANSWASISGATDTTFTTPLLSVSTSYRVRVSCGSTGVNTNSFPVSITTKPVAGTATVVASAGASSIVCNGGSKSLKLTGSTGSIQWQRASSATGPWGNVENATTATYLFTNIIENSWYRAEISNGVCTSVNSNVIALTMVTPPTAGSVSGSASALCNGSGATLTLEGSNGSIQWQKTVNFNAITPSWTTVAGTSSTLNVSGLTSSTAYRALVTSSPCPSVATGMFVITVSPKAVAGTAALNASSSALVCEGGAKSLKLTGSTGSIQWQQAGSATGPWEDLTNTNTTPVTFSDIQNNTWYRAKVSSGVCPLVYSNVMAITVKVPTLAGDITSSKDSVCTGSGTTLTLSNYSGTIIWQKSTNYATAATPSWSVAPGTNPVLTIASLSASTVYRAVLTNAPCTSSIATPILVTVSPKAVAGTAAVNNTSGLLVCKGGDKPLKLTGSVGTIQWQSSTTSATNGYVDVSDANTTPYTFEDIQSNTWYRAKLTSGVCPVLYSNSISIAAKTPTIAGNITTTSGSICSGSSKSLVLSGHSGTIAWQKSTNWTATTPTWGVATGTSATFPTGSLTASTAFRAVLTNSPCPSSTSEFIVVNVDPKVVTRTITANTTSPTGLTSATAICSSTTKTLTLGAGYVGNIQWQRATSAAGPWTSISGANLATYTISNPSLGANYFRVLLTSGACASATTASFVVYYKACTASILTLEADTVTANSATVGATISTNGLSNITAKGICWGTSENPTIAGSKTNEGTGSTAFTSTLSELNSGTTYYARAYATNAIGTVYGNQIILVTSETSAISTLPNSNNQLIQHSETNHQGAFNETIRKSPTQLLTSFEVLAYPNPFESSLQLSLSTTNQEMVQIRVMDLLGKVLENYEAEPSVVNEMSIGKSLHDGEYILQVTQGNEQRKIRVVKR